VEDLHEIYQEAMVKETLGEEINKGIIKLLPKEGDKTNKINWRPITLLMCHIK